MNQYSSTTVLVVDDAPEVRLLVRGILESEDYQVQTAQDGAEALGCLQQQPVDLIVLDLDLPDIQGTTLCRQLRHTGNQVPIVMLTSHNQELERVEGLDCGADDYMGKPFLPEELLARIRAQLRRQVSFQAEAENMLRNQWQRIQDGVRLTQRNQQQTSPSTRRLSGAVRHMPVGRIGGDFYLLEELEDQRTAVVVADAMGKGLPACLVMSSALSQTYELVHQGQSPQQVLTTLNARLGPELAQLGTFVAMFCGLYDEKSGVFSYACAGLEPPIWLRPTAQGRRHRRLTTHDIPVGVMPCHPYQLGQVQPAPGDQLFLFTDGLSESVPSAQQPALLRRLYRTVLRRDYSWRQKVDEIMAQVGHYTSLRDDLTFLLLEF